MNYAAGFEAVGRDDLATAGGKGANLGELVRAGLPVPAGFVVSTAAYRDFVESNDLDARIQESASAAFAAGDPAAAQEAADRIQALFTGSAIPDAMAKEITEAHLALVPDGGPVAVRSSATAEDLPGASFAGQQETYLNVRGSDALLDAVRRCWASLWTARAMGYRARQDIDPATVSLAVVVQVMVEADGAGVLFTANPANGRRTEAVVAAAWGLGESVVSGSVDTDDLVLDKASGRILSRRTADKAVSTIYAESGGTTEVPVPPARRREPVLDAAAAAELVALGVRIEEHFGAPQDIEWVRADGRFRIVQSRPITALPAPEADPPTDWTVPDPKAFYFRASIVEQLPDPLCPLFGDLAGPSVTSSLGALFEQVFGSGSLRPGDLGLLTVNGYAYYRYTRAGLWRMTWRSPAALRMLRGGRTHAGVRGWREYSHPRYVEVLDAWAARPLAELSPDTLLTGVRELLDAGTTYYTAVQSIIPIAATSEIAFTGYYDRLIRRDGDPAAPVLLLGYDSVPILAEKSLYDLATWTREQPGLADAVLATSVATLAERITGDPVVDPGGDGAWAGWRERFRAHLDRYGHTVYNLDFLNAVPADDPAPLLEALKFYLRGAGNDPHQRQRASAERREQAATTIRARLDRPRRAAFDRLLGWAQRTAPIREDALADIGLAWPLMRRILLELGRRLVADEVVGTPADVFWLRESELAEWARLRSAAGSAAGSAPAGLAGAGSDTAGLADVVAERRMLWRGRSRATPPQLLPERGAVKVFERWMPAAAQDQNEDVISGIGASAGEVTAPARVLAGPADFGRMQPGDVLVAGITTPAWTTLFAMASAVVTDVGGPLSHSSIVAREYGIPAVLGTSVATRRIQDGQRVRVDGNAGTVTLLDPDAAG